ncbi:MAG: hypothetical protein WKF97_08260 [Chitinophagaceae bacterium]
MKRSIIYSLIAILIFSACRKDDNIKIPDLIRVPVPLLVKDATGDQVISAQDPDKFRGKFVVDMFFKTDVPPQKMDVVIIKNGNRTNVKVVKEGITAYPTTLEVTGAQLASLFGAPVKVGDRFDIGVDITTSNGQKYLAFPTVGVPYGTGIANQPGASTQVRFEAVCAFTAAAYAGNFEVVVDEWEDYHPGDVIPVTVVDASTLSFLYGATGAKPILVKVNTGTNVTSVVKQSYGNYTTSPNVSTEFFAESVAGADNFVAPCELTLSVKLNHTSALGNYGNYIIKLKKK